MKWGPGAHGATFGGNPVSCAAALATLELVERDFMANAVTMGVRLMAGVQQLAQRHAVIGEVRGKGLMIGIEFVKDRKTREPYPELVARLERLAFSQGVVLLGGGEAAGGVAP